MEKSAVIRKIIKEERIKQGISIRKFAEMANCTARSLTYWENENRVPTIDMADKALKALGISVTIGKEENHEN